MYTSDIGIFEPYLPIEVDGRLDNSKYISAPLPSPIKNVLCNICIPNYQI